MTIAANSLAAGAQANPVPAKTLLPAKLPTQLFHAGHFWCVYQHIAPSGITLAQVSDPDYWQHVAALIKRRDVIEVLADDNSFEARFRVTNAVKGALRLRLLSYGGEDVPVVAPRGEAQNGQSPPAKPNEAGGLEVNFVAADKHRVVDTATKEVISKGHATKAEAETARANLLAARKAA